MWKTKIIIKNYVYISLYTGNNYKMIKIRLVWLKTKVIIRQEKEVVVFIFYYSKRKRGETFWLNSYFVWFEFKDFFQTHNVQYSEYKEKRKTLNFAVLFSIIFVCLTKENEIW